MYVQHAEGKLEKGTGYIMAAFVLIVDLIVNQRFAIQPQKCFVSARFVTETLGGCFGIFLKLR